MLSVHQPSEKPCQSPEILENILLNCGRKTSKGERKFTLRLPLDVTKIILPNPVGKLFLMHNERTPTPWRISQRKPYKIDESIKVFDYRLKRIRFGQTGGFFQITMHARADYTTTLPDDVYIRVPFHIVNQDIFLKVGEAYEWV